MTERKLKLVVDNEKKGLPPLKPRYVVPRRRCPFYGFYFASNASNSRAFVDFNTDEFLCALSQKRPGPCVMETSGQVVDWQECEINARYGKDLAEALSGINFFPQEFWPEGGASWDGLTFDEWKRYVMSCDIPLP